MYEMMRKLQRKVFICNHFDLSTAVFINADQLCGKQMNADENFDPASFPF